MGRLIKSGKKNDKKSQKLSCAEDFFLDLAKSLEKEIFTE